MVRKVCENATVSRVIVMFFYCKSCVMYLNIKCYTFNNSYYMISIKTIGMERKEKERLT